MRGGGPLKATNNKGWEKSSPHARGWSPGGGFCRVGNDVFPACAGVVPCLVRTSTSSQSLPRMRGGGPMELITPGLSSSSSPHARGWSPDFQGEGHARSVFPACAGVVPTIYRLQDVIKGLPRMRGGGPTYTNTPPPGESVFPACAGVVPLWPCSTKSGLSLPRMRGGGPRHHALGETSKPSSPHARGWSHWPEG